MKRNRVYLPQSLPLPFSAEQLDPLPRLIAILESSFDGIFVTDAQARPIWCNHSYEVISGLTAPADQFPHGDPQDLLGG